MPQKLMSLTLAALEEFAQFERLQDLLELCLEQLESTPEKKNERVELLIISHLALASLHLNELETYLDNIRREAIALREKLDLLS
jgi:hypothetical protein